MAGCLHALWRGLTKKNFVLVAKPYLDVYVIFVKSDFFFFVKYYLFLCLTLKAHKIIIHKKTKSKEALYEAANIN